jgi:hypothetical protein
LHDFPSAVQATAKQPIKNLAEVKKMIDSIQPVMDRWEAAGRLPSGVDDSAHGGSVSADGDGDIDDTDVRKDKIHAMAQKASEGKLYWSNFFGRHLAAPGEELPNSSGASTFELPWPVDAGYEAPQLGADAVAMLGGLDTVHDFSLNVGGPLSAKVVTFMNEMKRTEREATCRLGRSDKQVFITTPGDRPISREEVDPCKDVLEGMLVLMMVDHEQPTDFARGWDVGLVTKVWTSANGERYMDLEYLRPNVRGLQENAPWPERWVHANLVVWRVNGRVWDAKNVNCECVVWTDYLAAAKNARSSVGKFTRSQRTVVLTTTQRIQQHCALPTGRRVAFVPPSAPTTMPDDDDDSSGSDAEIV